MGKTADKKTSAGLKIAPGNSAGQRCPEAEAAGPDSSAGLRQDAGFGGLGEISPPSPSPA